MGYCGYTGMCPKIIKGSDGIECYTYAYTNTPVQIVKLVDLTDDSIDRIAEAILVKLKEKL